MAFAVIPGLDGLGFERDRRGQVRFAYCMRDLRCAHRFLPETPLHRDAALLHATAVSSDHWRTGCPSAGPDYTVAPSGQVRGVRPSWELGYPVRKVGGFPRAARSGVGAAQASSGPAGAAAARVADGVAASGTVRGAAASSATRPVGPPVPVPARRGLGPGPAAGHG